MLNKLKKFFNFHQVRGHNLLESPRTKIAHIEFTTRCNLRCVFCCASQPDYRGYDLDEKTIEHAVEALQTRHVDVVSVNGHGETTIYKNWYRYCNKMLDSGIPLHMTSNFARAFSADEIQTLSRFKSIEISCDTSDPVLFSKLRRGADLRTLCLNILNVRAAAARANRRSLEISFSCVVSDMNVLSLVDYVYFGKALGVTHFNFCNLTKYPDLNDTLNAKHITEMPKELMYKAAVSLTETFKLLKQWNIQYDVQQGLLDTVRQKYREMNLENPDPPPAQADQRDRDVAADGDGEVCEVKKEENPEAHEKETPAIKAGRPRRYYSNRPAAYTRDCLDPWQFIMLRANKDVVPCCIHQPIYSLESGQSLLEVFNNTQFKELRRRLLTGELSTDCLQCPTRGWTTPGDLKRKVWHYLNPGVYALLSPRIPAIKPDILESCVLDYGQGWYDTENDLDIEDPDWRTWKWTAGKAVCKLKNPKRKALLILRGLVEKPKCKDQKITIKLNEKLVEAFIPGADKFFKEYVITPEMMGEDEELSLIIETDHVLVPALLEPDSTDNRELGFRVYHLFFGEKK
jgi:MoaA/NifB/PqqE/SkfB family radical SAM enzyme